MMNVYFIPLYNRVVDSMKRYRWDQVLDFSASIMSTWWVTLTSFYSGAQILELYRGTTLTFRGMYLHLRSTSAQMKWGETPGVIHPSSDRLPTVLLHTHCFSSGAASLPNSIKQHWALSGLQLGKGKYQESDIFHEIEFFKLYLRKGRWVHVVSAVKVALTLSPNAWAQQPQLWPRTAI